MKNDISPDAKSRRVIPVPLFLLVSVLAASVVVLVVTAYLFIRTMQLFQGSAGPTSQGADTNQIIETIGNSDIKLEVGRHYRMRIEDEAREFSSGIAHVGGLDTFVPETRSGDVVVVSITRIEKSTAKAVVLEREENAPVAAAVVTSAPPARTKPLVEDVFEPTRHALPVGQTYSGKVKYLGKQGDGIVRVNGKVVFVPGAGVGQDVEFVIVEDQKQFARGRLISAKGTAIAPPQEPTGPSAEEIQQGLVLELQITEKEKKNPDVNGVARVKGLVIFVPGTQPGDHVRVKIVERRQRFARAEVLERLDQADVAP